MAFQMARNALYRIIWGDAAPQTTAYTSIQRLMEADFVWMDKFTIRNLLYHSNDANAVTLIHSDKTLSPMGEDFSNAGWHCL